MGSAAVVTRVAGGAFVLRDGRESALEPGAEIFTGDILRTASGAKLELRFHDGSELDLGALTSVNVSDFVFDEAGVPPTFGLHVLQGLARTATGKVAEQNPEGFSLTTPLGSVDIRGTVIWTSVSEKQVIFTVTSLGEGHTVIIATADGRSVIIHVPETGVIITEGDSSPLHIFDMTANQLQDYLKSVFQEDVDSVTPQGFYIHADAEFLASLGRVGVTAGLVSFGEVDTLIGALENLGVERGDIESGRGDIESGRGGIESGRGGLIPAFPTVVLQGTPGADSIIGAPNQNHIISAWSGNDFVVVYNGTDVVEGGYGSSDVIVKLGNMADGSVIYGDERGMSGGTSDQDYILVRGEGNESDPSELNSTNFGVITMSGGAIYGDGHTLDNVDASIPSVAGDSVGASGNVTLSSTPMPGDTIRVVGFMTGGAIYGDAYSYTAASGNAAYIFGQDSISIEQGLDAGGNMVGGVMSGGVIYGDAYVITAESAWDIICADDDISVYLLTGSAAIYGDAYTTNTSNGTIGGADTIKIDSMTGGTIYGDFHSFNAGTDRLATFGNDTIQVNNVFSGGTIYGDARTITGVSRLNGGSDLITINADGTGGMSGGTVYGDAYRVEMDYNSGGISNSLSLGQNQIFVGVTSGPMMTGGTIYGNAHEISIINERSTSATSGFSDSIIVNTGASGCTIYGDAYVIDTLRLGDLSAPLTADNFMSDLIEIHGDLTNSVIYGDAHSIGNLLLVGNNSTVLAGFMSDTIMVDGILGAGAIIYGDTENGTTDSVFIYTNSNIRSIDYIGQDTIEVGALDKGKILSGFGHDMVTVGNVLSTGVVDLGTGDDTLFLNGLADGAVLYLDFGDDDGADTLDISTLTMTGSDAAHIYLYNYDTVDGDTITFGGSWAQSGSTADSFTYINGSATLTIHLVSGSLDAGITL